MTVDTNTQPLIIVQTLTAKIEECIDLLCDADEAHQVDSTTSGQTMNALCDAYAFITSGVAATSGSLAKLNEAAQQIKDADQDAPSVDRNWVE